MNKPKIQNRIKEFNDGYKCGYQQAISDILGKETMKLLVRFLRVNYPLIFNEFLDSKKEKS